MKITDEEMEEIRREISNQFEGDQRERVASLKIYFEMPNEWVSQQWTSVITLTKKIKLYTCAVAFSGLIISAAILMPDGALDSFGGTNRRVPSSFEATEQLSTYYYNIYLQGKTLPIFPVEPHEAADFVDLALPAPTIIPYTGLVYPVQRVFLPYSGVSGIPNAAQNYPNKV